MAEKRRLAHWLLLPAHARLVPGERVRPRVAASAAALTVALVVTAGVSLAAGADQPHRAAAKVRAPRTPTSALEPVGILIQKGSLPAPTLTGDQGTVGVPPRTPARPTAPIDLAAGATAAHYAGRAGSMTPVGIATLAMQRGCSSTQAVVATAVAMAESGGSPSAQGDVRLMDGTWDWSAGLWQIRGLKAQRNTGALRDSVANQNAVTNSVAMYAISSGCTNWTPWSTYNTGAYQGYTTIAAQAVRYVVAYYRAHGRYPAVAPPDPNAVVPVPTGGVDPAAAAGAGATPTPSSRTSAAKPAPGHASGGATAAAGGGTSAGRPAGSHTTPAAPKPAGSTSSTPGKQPIVSTLPLPSKVKSIIPTVTVPVPVPSLLCPPLCG